MTLRRRKRETNVGTAERNDPPAIVADGGLQWDSGESITGARLCNRCGRVHGRLLILGDGEPFPFPQVCFCRPARERGRPHEGLDLSTCLELCRCCAFEPIRTRSRWSSFYCDTCRTRVLAANKGFGAWVIPIGRHSMMHNLSLTAEAVDSEEQVEAFAGEVRGLFGGIEHLGAWTTGQTKRHLATLGLGATDLPLSAFVEAARASPLDKQDAFEGLLRHFGRVTPIREWRGCSVPAATATITPVTTSHVTGRR